MATNSAFQLTVLTSMNVNAVKTFRRSGGKKIEVEGYGRAKKFTVDTIDVDTNGDWLRQLRKKKYSFVVLGEPVGWKKGQKKRRMSVDRDGQEATLKDVPRALMPIDVDQIDFTPTLDGFDEGESLAYDVLDRLGLRGIRCVWHLTNSHGFFGKHRIRLWIELSTPATAAEMKEWAKGRWGDDKVKVDGKDKPIVDLSVYQPQQPIYTGDPILEGVDPPCRKRIGVIDGDALEMSIPKSRSDKKKKGPPEDENIKLLDEAGLYIGRLKPGQHMIECPWEDAHSGASRDDDTFYFEPHFNGHDIPAFKCHHGSCEEKRWADVVEFIGDEVDPSEDDRPKATPNWVYVHRLKAFWDARDGAFIDRESYDSTHGGKTAKGTPTERFLQMSKSQKADAAEFLPGAERFVQRGKLRVLNTYVDQRVEPDDSIDVAPWVEHLEWLIPSDKDRDYLMDWLAWTYQRPGDKITWAPILYSKSFGVGKTTVFNCLAECIGKSAVSEPTQAELEDKFNDWCYGKLLVKIEELMSGDKYHVAEKLKPVVTNPTLSIRRMHQTGFVVVNTANVGASTNHMQSLPIERGDRRWMMIQCVEAEKAERRPRMRRFHKWLASVGYGGIAHWLASRDVSEFQPRGEAPDTPLREVVAQASMTDFDRAVELCDVFDSAPVISTAMVAEYLSQNECKINERRIGLIAARRGWVGLGSQENRVMVGNRKLTFWTSGRSTVMKLKAFLAKKPAERERQHSNMMAKAVFSPQGGESEEAL